MSDSSTANRWIVVSCPSCGLATVSLPSSASILPIRFSISPYSRDSLGAATPFQDWPRDSRLPRFCLWIMAHRYPGPQWLYQADVMYIHRYIRVCARCFINTCQQIRVIPPTLRNLLTKDFLNRYISVIYNFCEEKNIFIFY